MYIEFQWTGNLDSDSVDTAMGIAEDLDSEDDAWAAVDALQCKSRCGKCSGCATAEAIWDRGSFWEHETIGITTKTTERKFKTEKQKDE